LKCGILEREVEVIEFALLRIVEGSREAKELKIPAGTAAVLGRGEDCWEILDQQDLTLGRHHCRLAVEKTRVYLEDLHSLNGTFVNSQRLDPAKGPVPLTPGDMIRIGKSTLCLGLGLAASCGACGRPVRWTIHLDFGGQASEKLYCQECWDAASQERAGGTATTRMESMGGAGSVEWPTAMLWVVGKQPEVGAQRRAPDQRTEGMPGTLRRGARGSRRKPSLGPWRPANERSRFLNGCTAETAVLRAASSEHPAGMPEK
jgi:hypothetical protein